MRDWKLTLCAVFFLLVSALRLGFPAQADAAQRLIADTVDPQRSCRGFALRLGRELEAFDPRDRLVAVFGRAEEARR